MRGFKPFDSWPEFSVESPARAGLSSCTLQGSHAKHYTPEQLKRMHREVQKLASVLLEIHESRRRARGTKRSPQASLDRSKRTVHQ